MKELPTQDYVLTMTIHAKVQNNFQMFLGQYKNYYSVPYQYVSKQGTVLYSSLTVEVFIVPE